VAADAAAPEAAAGANDFGALEEITVTARRREESLQEVPTSVVALDQKALTQRSVASSYDLSKIVPGLSVNSDSGNAGLPVFAIRGRGQNYGAAAGSVETYFADVPLSAPFQMPTLPPQFFDIQSLQVLKGPQGTLFGRSTTGGAIVIVPQAPTDQLGGYVRLQGGSYSDFQFEGAINVPIIGDRLDARLAVFDWQRDGYMKTVGGLPENLTGKILPPQTYDNVDTKEVRLTVLAKPIDGLTNSTIFTYHFDRTRASSGSGFNLLGPAVIPGSVFDPSRQVYLTPGFDSRYTNTSVELTKPSTNVWAALNTTSYDLTSQLTVKNIFGYIHSRGYTNDAADDDGTPLPVIDLPVVPRPRLNKQTTDELQLQGHNLDNRLTWVVGGLMDQTREPGGLDSINVVSLVNSGGSYVSRFQQNTINSWAAYGSATYKILDNLEGTVGYRHSWDHVESLQGAYPGIDGLIPPNSGALSALGAKFAGNTYNADLSYHLTKQNMLYGGYRHGFKRGGFNSSVTDPSLIMFQPEEVNDYYIGSKNDFEIADMVGRFNIEAYYDLYHGQQVSYLSGELIGGNFILIAPTTNVPNTRYVGFDAEAQLDPTPWAVLSVNYAYLDAKNTNWTDNTFPGMTADLTVNPVIYAPKNKITGTIRLHEQLPNNLGEVAIAPSVNFQSLFYTTPLSKQLPLAEAAVFGQIDMAAHGAAQVPAYTTIDMRVEWNNLFNTKFDVALNGTNLTNRTYLSGTSATLSFGVEGLAYGPPRMFSADVSTKF
jgi:iron complex outermembrane receptor protein